MHPRVRSEAAPAGGEPALQRQRGHRQGDDSSSTAPHTEAPPLISPRATPPHQNQSSSENHITSWAPTRVAPNACMLQALLHGDRACHAIHAGTLPPNEHFLSPPSFLFDFFSFFLLACRSIYILYIHHLVTSDPILAASSTFVVLPHVLVVRLVPGPVIGTGALQRLGALLRRA